MAEPVEGTDEMYQIEMIDAEHCPGSAMFLITSGREGWRYLITGDFRYSLRTVCFFLLARFRGYSSLTLIDE
jgi:Cft2 family RNA processing exonuclease